MQYAKDIDSSVKTFKTVLQETYKLKYCIQIASVAPAPLWDIEPLLKKLYPQKGISSFLGSSAEIRAKLYNGDTQLVILGESISDKEAYATYYAVCSKKNYTELKKFFDSF